MRDGTTLKQRAFAAAFVRHLGESTNAAMSMGLYKNKNTAKQMAKAWLDKPGTMDLIEQLAGPRLEFGVAKALKRLDGLLEHPDTEIFFKAFDRVLKLGVIQRQEREKAQRQQGPEKPKRATYNFHFQTTPTKVLDFMRANGLDTPPDEQTQLAIMQGRLTNTSATTDSSDDASHADSQPPRDKQ